MSYIPGLGVLTPLFILDGADMQSTADQQFTKLGNFTNWILLDVYATRKTGGATVACSGGIYSAASKGGTATIGAGQSWLGLSGGNKYVHVFDPTTNNGYNITTPYLSLTTGSTAACTATFRIYGRILD